MNVTHTISVMTLIVHVHVCGTDAVSPDVLHCNNNIDIYYQFKYIYIYKQYSKKYEFNFFLL